MITPVMLTKTKIVIEPACNILKAKDYAAYLKSENMIENTKKKMAKEYEYQKNKGYQDGVDVCKSEQAEQMLKVVSRTINYLSEVEKSMADLLITSIKKIIGDFKQEDLAVGLVRSALQHVRNEKQVTIRIPSSQYMMVKSKINEILKEYPGVGFIDLIADQKLSTGDCIMESEIGIVNASVDIQLQALQKRFELVNTTLNKKMIDKSS